MWRVVLIVIAVVALDCLLLAVGAPDLDWNMREISQALRARDENPNLETQRALVAALDKGGQMKGNAAFGFVIAILAITNVGLFIAGFTAGRRPWRVRNSEVETIRHGISDQSLQLPLAAVDRRLREDNEG